MDHIEKDYSQSRPSIKAFIPVVLALMTGIVLLFNQPDAQVMRAYDADMVIYAFLTALVLLFGVWLSEGTFSPAYIFGMVAFLSLPETVASATMWSVFVGGLIGSVALVLPEMWLGDEGFSDVRPFLASVAYKTARVTLSFFLAGQVFLALEGNLPLDGSMWEADPNIGLALLVYGLVYVTLYVAIFALEIDFMTGRVHEIIVTNLSLIFVIVVLPIPFALISAELGGALSQPSVLMSRLGLVIVVFGLHALSRSERQLHKQVDELQMLARTTRSIQAQLDMRDLLYSIYRQVADLLMVENFTIVICKNAAFAEEMSLVIHNGVEDANNSVDLIAAYDNTLTGHVLQTGKPLLISQNLSSMAQSLRVKPLERESISWMGVPLVVGDKTLGVMAVASESKRRYFDQNDMNLFTIVADSASSAIETAQLYGQQKNRLEQMVTLNRILALLSETLSSEAVLDMVISSASALSQSSAVAVYLYREQPTLELDLVRSAGLTLRFGDAPPMPLIVQEDLQLRSQTPLAITAIDSSPQARPLRDLLLKERQQSMVELPLMLGEMALGVLVLYFEEQQSFDVEQLELLRTFSTQVAQAISNARIFTSTDEAFQRSAEQLLTLAGVGRLLASTINLKAIGDLVLAHIVPATEAVFGLVALYENNDQVLKPLASFPPEATVESALVVPKVPGGHSYSADTQADPHAVPLRKTTRSQLIIPIDRGEDRLGYVWLESDHVVAYSQEDIHFAEQIANQAVVAIDNAQLFEHITQARDRLQVILDTIDEGVILLNRAGSIVLANPRVTMIGLAPDAILDRDLTDLVRDPSVDITAGLGFDSADQIFTLVDDLQRQSKFLHYQAHLFVAPGEGESRYIERSIRVVSDENGRTIGVLLVFYDKSEEQELERAREELSRMIVHDLRSPLTAVTTSLKLMRETVGPNNPAHEMVHMAADASQRAVRKLLSRVDTLLDVAKMESGRMVLDMDATESATLVDAVYEELEPLAVEIEVSLRTEIVPELPLLHVDADKVERVLLNLVDNALKYSPAQTSVCIRMTPAAQQNGGRKMVQVDVVDNGPGIPDDYKQALFDRFVQVEGRKKVRRGVGLGLTFCKLVVEAHHGQIWIEDNAEGGSVFSFTLPAFDIEELSLD